jgi:metal-responsive CopG/Arc/MetJ family transcriptional regulator
MSDKNHTGEIKITFWLDQKTAAEFDTAIEANKYKNRAEWFRERVRQEIKASQN